MPTLFVLIPAGHELDDLLVDAPSLLVGNLSRLRRQRYPPAADSEHLASLVLAIGGRAATIESVSVARCVLHRSVLGATGAAVLSLCGGIDVDLAIAVPAGATMGALLGVYHHSSLPLRLRPPVADLVHAALPGDELVSWTGRDLGTLQQLHGLCERARLQVRLDA